MTCRVFALIVLLHVPPSVALQQGAPNEGRSVVPPESEDARRTKALVDKAAVLIERQGKAAAFTELRRNGTEWFDGDTYVFAYDMNLNVLLNPAFPQREGTNVSGQRDARGQAIHDEIRRVAQTAGAGWVNTLFPRPGTTQPVEKWVHVKLVTMDGNAAIIGSGFYPK